MSDPRLFPIQERRRGAPPATVPESVYMAAYEVYAHVYGKQEAMIDLEAGCRGGFSAGEVAAFLYARSFPARRMAFSGQRSLQGCDALSGKMVRSVAWTGPRDSDRSPGGTTLRHPVPSERWPYGRPAAHDDHCGLHRGGLFCDCSASDESA